MFKYCSFIGNQSDGFVTNQGGESYDYFTHDFMFDNCTFVSGAYQDASGNYIPGYAARPDGRSITFKCSDFHGYINECYSYQSIAPPSPSDPSTRFYSCTFNETYQSPIPGAQRYSHTQDLGTCFANNYDHYSMINLFDRYRVNWNSCTFITNRFDRWMSLDYTASFVHPYNRNVIENSAFYNYGLAAPINHTSSYWLANLRGVKLKSNLAFVPASHANCNCSNAPNAWCYYVLFSPTCLASDVDGTFPLLTLSSAGSNPCLPSQCPSTGYIQPTGLTNSNICYGKVPPFHSPRLWNIYNTCNPPLCAHLEPATCPSSSNRIKKFIEQEKVRDSGFEISPNPFTDRVSIGSLSEGDKIRINSVLGETLYIIEVEENLVQISLADLKPGIYIVTINNGVSKKIVKL